MVTDYLQEFDAALEAPKTPKALQMAL